MELYLSKDGVAERTKNSLSGESGAYLAAKGFTPLTNPVMRSLMGKKISLENALLSKKLDVSASEKEMCALIENKTQNTFECADPVLRGNTHTDTQKAAGCAQEGKKTLRIEGVLPCPIRIPLMEKFEEFYNTYTEQNKDLLQKENCVFTYDLRSANLGIDWLCEQARTGKAENLPDIVLSAGFELFFDKNLMGRFLQNKVFSCPVKTINTDFCNDYIDLRDSEQNYAIIGVVPAIMMVNTSLLNGRKIPQTWADLLSGEFENSLSLPFRDLDLFNSVLLYIYKAFGNEGITKLAKACGVFLHPAQMVKSNKNKSNAAAVHIAPYFFSKMLQKDSPVKVVWPEDGAIVAPIFMLVKKETAALTQPFTDFFLSAKTGTVFAQSGFFPSTNAQVNNNLSDDKKFLWVGWDFIRSHDIGKLLNTLRNDFEKQAE